MRDYTEQLTTFYRSYNVHEIKAAYENARRQYWLFSTPKINPYTTEIRMKNHILALQVDSDFLLPEQGLTILGYFFEYYSPEKNCVWTKSVNKIKDLFTDGLLYLRYFGGKIKLDLSRDSIRSIVKMLSSQNEDMIDALCENFCLLEEMSWFDYEKHIRQKIQTEKEHQRIAKITCMELPSGWINPYATDEKATDIYAESIADGLALSLNYLGVVDIEYISQITGESYQEVILALKGTIYQNPDTWEECFYKGWELASEYLSGRVLDKLEKAQKANRTYQGYFAGNILALKNVLPKAASKDSIYITLGSPWVPTDIIDKFIEHLLGTITPKKRGGYKVIRDPETGVWRIPQKSRYDGDVKSNNTYGTTRIEALSIIEKTLNIKNITVFDEVPSDFHKSGTKKVINETETILAIDKQNKIIQEFQKWVWADEFRKKRLIDIYEEKYVSRVARHYNGSFLTFPNMAKTENLFEYQKNAVARILFASNTLLAHEVGAGKTYVMIAAGMELRRLGISKKNLYVVPNSITGQWEGTFQKLYPDVKLLCVTPGTFTKEHRLKVLEQIRDNDYDGIIIAYSCFEMIPVRKGQEDMLIGFDELGINTLFVDEAHNYKNLPIDTKIKGVLGISPSGSAKCQNMMEKVRIVQRDNKGRGVVFATGTPITNSLTDIYVMQRYLQSEELKRLDIYHFDSWVGMFAERVSELEIGVDVNRFRIATRFSKFHNLPELSVLLSKITDFYQVDKTNGIPQMEGYRDVVIKKTDAFKRFLFQIAERADYVQKGYISRKDDNMLKITTDGRKAALDLRLVDDSSAFEKQCKVAQCAEKVYEIYQKTQSAKLTQLVFCDVSTPKPEFNIYDEMKRLLLEKGVWEGDIAYIHDAKTDAQRNELFQKVQKGEIRVLLGSTFKLGIGVNVQNKLIALHHLDVPWRPADMIQREGRILRKGNENEEVFIYRYIAEGSFDAYSWQLLESKQKMINGILSGCMTERGCLEVADTVLNYAEIKAIAIGNPLLKKRMEISNELSRNLTLQKKQEELKLMLEAELAQLPYEIERQKKIVAKYQQDADFYQGSKRVYSAEQRKAIREQIYQELVANELYLKERVIGSYQGFNVILPANMTKRHPFVYLEKYGRYYIPMGDKASGILVRIDNFLKGIEDQLAKQKDKLESMRRKEKDIKSDLKKGGEYITRIEELAKELAEIDKRLGVKEM